MTATHRLPELFRAAADAVRSADALLIGAGAGMGVDSGLPDFRGAEGFWKAYPPFRGRQFAELSTPHWFGADPALAWGFFGHRLNLYRTATPHRGFAVLRRARIAVQDDTAALNGDKAAANAERDIDVLFDQKNGAPRIPHLRDNRVDVRDDHGGEAFAGLVDQKQFRLAHQNARDGQHLLLAAR